MTLLTRENPITIKQLQQRLNVSRTTTTKDLDATEKWIAQRGLCLVRRPNFGCQIQGPEDKWQEALCHFLLEHVKESYLLALCVRSRMVQPQKPNEVGFARLLSEYFTTLELEYSEELVTWAEQEIGVHFVDQGRIALVLHIAVLIARLRKGRRICKAPSHTQRLKKRSEYAIVEEIATHVERHCCISLTEAEKIYLTEQLMRVEKKQPFEEMLPKALAEKESDLNIEAKAIVNNLLEYASFHLHPSLRVDQQLIRNLTLHIGPAIEQLRLGIRFRNPLTEEIKKRYPYVFEVTQASTRFLINELGQELPPEEIGYITMYLVAAMERLRPRIQPLRKLLIVCSGGIATSWLLKSRIQAELPGVEITGVISVVELHAQGNLIDADVIVCTVPLRVQYPNIPTVIVSPLLPTEDLERLRHVLYGPEPSKRKKQNLPTAAQDISLAHLLTTRTIGLRIYAKDWQAAVDQAAWPLLNTGAIKARYIEAMKKIIYEYGPYMVAWPGIALLHARPEDGVGQLCMSLITLQEPIAFGHETNDPVDIVIALGAVDDRLHLPALLELYDLLQEDEAVSTIRDAQTRSEILRLFSDKR
jgi:transcriptional antiterminator/mannitol/fructose-specific phosphotransferase system IIA component (Ntr-type)